jgi:hypothetical protein
LGFVVGCTCTKIGTNAALMTCATMSLLMDLRGERGRHVREVSLRTDEERTGLLRRLVSIGAS